MDQILPELLKVGGPAALLVVLYWLLVTGRMVVGKVYDREVKRADDMQDLAASLSKSLEGIANSENLAVALLKSVEAKAKENAQEGGDQS